MKTNQRVWAATCGDLDIILTLDHDQESLQIQINDFLMHIAYQMILRNEQIWSLDHTILNNVEDIYRDLISGLEESDQQVDLQLISEEDHLPPRFDLLLRVVRHDEKDALYLTLTQDATTVVSLEETPQVSLEHTFRKAIHIELNDGSMGLAMYASQMGV